MRLTNFILKILSLSIKKEILSITQIIRKNFKSAWFWVWSWTMIWVLWKLRYLTFIWIMWSIFCSFFIIFIKKKIRIKKNPVNIFNSFFKISIIMSLGKTSINLKTIVIIIPFLIFKLIFGINYKFFKWMLLIFDNLREEFEKGNLIKKKITKKIYLRFLKNAINNFLYNEFNKTYQGIKRGIEIEKFGFRVRVEIITDIQW